MTPKTAQGISDIGEYQMSEIQYFLTESTLQRPQQGCHVDHLMAVRQGNHFREWLVFFLFGVEETARASVSVFRSVQRLNGGHGLCQGCCLKISR